MTSSLIKGRGHMWSRCVLAGEETQRLHESAERDGNRIEVWTLVRKGTFDVQREGLHFPLQRHFILPEL